MSQNSVLNPAAFFPTLHAVMNSGSIGCAVFMKLIIVFSLSNSISFSWFSSEIVRSYLSSHSSTFLFW
jgi:hypothetical protein